ncbi:hypothetical protein BGZ60DRAFT_534142 [Tricladium varicosporioides]|nr:hypothetical protein BGZ60DRAFT_534142 [Hymenoscyphus varicosporioides]
MSQTYCTDLIRYLAPNRFPNSPPLTFLSLPREIRDKIYDLALVSSSNIVVWDGKWKSETRYISKDGSGALWFAHLHRDWTLRWRNVDQEAISSTLRPLAVKILLCNKVVSHEAALVFYSKNTYSFMGEHNWDPVVAWLEMIGPKNRNLLVSMEIDAYRPDVVWQLSSGERVREPGGCTSEEIYPRNPYLHLSMDGNALRYGQVENINPSIETIFILLGQRISEHKVDIALRPPLYLYPGGRAPRGIDDHCPWNGWYSMDLPNLVEKFRSLHSRRVEVLWKGKECRQELEDQQAILEEIGWDVNVLPSKHDEIHPNPEFHFCHPVTGEWRIASYVLRRKELAGTLWAQDPCPYHDLAPGALHRYI